MRLFPVRPRLAGVAGALGLGLAAAGVAGAGHELTFYPSFYPQEITLKVADAAAAARGLEKSELHAYIGADPFAGRTPPEHVRYVESLGGLVTLALAPATPAVPDASARCAAGARVRGALAGAAVDGFVASDYPVTPFHPDWLVHYDLAQPRHASADRGGATAAVEPPRAGARPLHVRAPARFAAALAKAGITVTDTGADATIEVTDPRGRADELHAPWAKEGWFQTARLYAATDRRTVPAALVKREHGEYAGAAERAGLERAIVAGLLRGCARVPLGYLVRREAYSAEYSDGVENVAWDSDAGLGSAIFLRTVKLKDFMWNGWLTLGVPEKPAAAWNPVAGFGDIPGRLVWAAVGDPALLPSPYAGGWMANRAEPGDLQAGPLDVPADALAPDPATGALRGVGPGQRAAAKVAYRVRFSKFHDGTKMTAGDVLAPYAFAVRRAARDPEVARTTALARERFVAVRLVRMETDIRELGDLTLFYDVARIEVYLRGGPATAEAAAIAPPWSAVPWEVQALMDEAVARGVAAFSEGEARRRGVPWLDLARDPRLRGRLAALTQELERRAFVPDALRALVTSAEGRARWAALGRFAREHGHYLVTNGPYRLGKVASDAVVLDVVRDFSYPIGLGSLDGWALPRRAYVTGVETTPGGLVLSADVEIVEKFQRSYRILRGPFRPEPAGAGFGPPPPVAHYVVLGGDGEVKAAGVSERLDGDRLVVALDALPPGDYRVTLALTLGGNLVNPEVKVVTWTRS